MTQLLRRTIEDLGCRYTPLPLNDTRYSKLPYCLRPLLENTLRHADRDQEAAEGAENILNRVQGGPVPFWPSRVLLQEGLGIPLLTDLTAFRDAAVARGLDPNAVDTAVQTDLIIDHSLRVDSWATPAARALNERIELKRNGERFAFVRWAQGAYTKLRVVPPGKGIMHQLNLERLASVVVRSDDTAPFLSPDTLVGTDSHTPMINGIGVVGWGVGGIEAEEAMLDKPVVFALPKVTGVEVAGHLPEGATATDLVLTITETLRAQDVVGHFVEFFGAGLTGLTVADRATIANMAPEYGATMAYFPVDERTIDYLRMTGREPAQVDTVETYTRQQQMWFSDSAPVPEYDAVIRVNLAEVHPCIAGPRNPEQRIDLTAAAVRFDEHWGASTNRRARNTSNTASGFPVEDGAILIAAITSCTNTSNPVGMATAGLVARKARLAGLMPKPWVKTSFTPGSRVVAEQLKKTGLLDDLNTLGFQIAGFGCATCNGNSGDLSPEITDAVVAGEIFGTAVLSGNRNFAGRIHPHVSASYLASPALVVVYAIAGSMFTNITTESLDPAGEIFLRDLWPSSEEVAAVLDTSSSPKEFARSYDDLFEGSDEWNALPLGTPSPTFAWDRSSNYIRRPPWFEHVAAALPIGHEDIEGARALVVLGDSVTTDDISPSGAIHPDSPAGRYLRERGVEPKDFNSYVSRRANHLVAQRATFANRRLKNAIMGGKGGPFTKVFPEGDTADVYDAAVTYHERRVPLLVFAGRNYGCGSSRDWAAKGPTLLGVKAIVAGSFERIHRSNLVRMNLIPLQLPAGTDIDSLELDGSETFDVRGISGGLAPNAPATLLIHRADGRTKEMDLTIRIETHKELEYLRNGGVLPAIMRELIGGNA